MSKISLYSDVISDVTIVSNKFIDQYMPSANGAYVKVYLYLLRCYGTNYPEITISFIADHLENTEKDIIRALNYWEKQKLLSLEYNEQTEITAIHFVDLTSAINTAPDNNSAVINSPDKEKASDSAPDEIAVSIHTEKKPIRQSYSTEKIAELTNNDKIKWIMHIVEVYLNRPLKPMDIDLIVYLYEELHFSAELIMYLFEYCVSKNKKNTSYIEAVALSWAEKGIDTEEKAREESNAYDEHFNAVNKAFGLNRAPGQIERQYITKWVAVYSFSDDIITQACNRTLLRTQKPDFKYTDKILEIWFKKGVKSLEDITRLDDEFSKGNKSTAPVKTASVPKPGTNKFNQFPQRTYTAKDYAELERKLLNKGL